MNVAIGAPGDFTDYRRGYVKIYHKEENGSSWNQLGQVLNGETAGDGLGEALSISADGRV